MTPEDETARDRWMLLQLLRFSGVAMVVLGLLVLLDRLAWPEPVGIALLAIGLADFFILPKVLAGKWKSPPE